MLDIPSALQEQFEEYLETSQFQTARGGLIKKDKRAKEGMTLSIQITQGSS